MDVGSCTSDCQPNLLMAVSEIKGEPTVQNLCTVKIIAEAAGGQGALRFDGHAEVGMSSGRNSLELGKCGL